MATVWLDEKFGLAGVTGPDGAVLRRVGGTWVADEALELPQGIEAGDVLTYDGANLTRVEGPKDDGNVVTWHAASNRAIWAPPPVATAPAFDPATLTLSAYAAGAFSASPWVGTASAGTSGTHNAAEPTNPPSAGTAVNGLTPAAFDGVNDRLVLGFNVSDLVTATAWSAWALVHVNAIVGTSVNCYDNEAIFAASSELWGMHLATIGGTPKFQAYQSQADGSVRKAEVTIALGVPQLLQMKLEGGFIKARVNGGSWTPTASTAMFNTNGSSVNVGKAGVAAAFFNGKLFPKWGIAPVALSDANFDSIRGVFTAAGFAV